MTWWYREPEPTQEALDYARWERDLAEQNYQRLEQDMAALKAAAREEIAIAWEEYEILWDRYRRLEQTCRQVIHELRDAARDCGNEFWSTLMNALSSKLEQALSDDNTE